MQMFKLSLAVALTLLVSNHAFAGESADEPAPNYQDQPDDSQTLPPPQAYQPGAPPLPPPCDGCGLDQGPAFDPGANYVCNDPNACAPLPLPDGYPLTPVPPPITYYYYNYPQPYVQPYAGGYYGGRGFVRPGIGGYGYGRPGYGAGVSRPNYGGGGRPPVTYGGRPNFSAPGGRTMGGGPVGGNRPMLGGGRPMMGAPRGGVRRMAFDGCEIKQLNNGEVVVLGLDDKLLFDRSTPKAMEAAEVVKKWYEANTTQCGFTNSSKSKALDI